MGRALPQRRREHRLWALFRSRGQRQLLQRWRSLLIRMGHTLRRFQRERGMALSRPVAANSPLQSYFINADFAAVASDLFGERMPDQRSSGLRRP